MATTLDYAEYVCGQIATAGEVSMRKMFGEYVVYLDGRPVLMVCDNQVFVKPFVELSDLLPDAPMRKPYPSAKPHWVLDVDDAQRCVEVVRRVATLVPLPAKRSRSKRR